MRYYIIPDPHGSPQWKSIKNLDSPNVIFIGDYCDSYYYSPLEWYANLCEIIEYKKKNFSKTTLLLGNHDLSYYFYGTRLGVRAKCPGFDEKIAERAKNLFIDNKYCFEAAKLVENTLFTHAGVTKSWYDAHVIPYKLENPNTADLPLDIILNLMFARQEECILNRGLSRYGVDETSGFFWADKSEFIQDRDELPAVHQVIGHSFVKESTLYTGRDGEKIWFVDNEKKKHLLINITE